MKPRISTLPQAQKRLWEAIAAASEVGEYLDGLSATLGLSVANGVAASQSANGKMPTSMGERVVKIISDSGKPIKPKDIVSRYVQLDWNDPKGGRAKLYEAISGSLSYLLNRKHILRKTKKGYTIKTVDTES